MENKPASLLVAPLGKALNGSLPLYVANRWWGQAIYVASKSWWPSLNEDLQTEQELLRSESLSSCIMLSTIAQATTTKGRARGNWDSQGRPTDISSQPKRGRGSHHRIEAAVDWCRYIEFAGLDFALILEKHLPARFQLTYTRRNLAYIFIC